ncbi:MAG: hypothetical protein LBE85_01375 [Candidatus Accumulibacter sp.]|jgi:hypothetical protein|nr:hypothetical protein [Accumulibacter sp.]
MAEEERLLPLSGDVAWGAREFDAERAKSFTSATGESLRISREDDGEKARLTVTFSQRDGRTLNVRKITRPKPDPLRLYQTPGISPLPAEHANIRSLAYISSSRSLRNEIPQHLSCLLF